MKKRIVVGVSGASGAPLALRLLEELKKLDGVESYLVVSSSGKRTIEEECACSFADFISFADVSYDDQDIGAAIASGSFRHDGMIVLPCSMKTVAGIAMGYAENLLLRAADVSIKEQRRLVLAVRENPLSKIHLENMVHLAAIPNVFIAPPVLSYYHKPDSFSDMEDQLSGKYLELLGIETALLKRWQGNEHTA